MDGSAVFWGGGGIWVFGASASCSGGGVWPSARARGLDLPPFDKGGLKGALRGGQRWADGLFQRWALLIVE